MKLGFQFVPFPREIWTEGIELSQVEFRLLGWFCCGLRFGVRQLEMSDDNILNGFQKEGESHPPVGLSRNSMQKARASLVERGLLVATQISGGGGRGKAAIWTYLLNLSDCEKKPETSQGLTINPADCEKNTPLNLSSFDNAIRKEKRNTSTEESEKTLVAVWEYYIHKLKRNPKTYTFSDARRKQGLARLKECVKKCDGDFVKAETMMRAAIDILSASEFHRERGYDDWEQVFRSQDKFENWFTRRGNDGKGNHRHEQQREQILNDREAVHEILRRKGERINAGTVDGGQIDFDLCGDGEAEAGPGDFSDDGRRPRQ